MVRLGCVESFRSSLNPPAHDLKTLPVGWNTCQKPPHPDRCRYDHEEGSRRGLQLRPSQHGIAHEPPWGRHIAMHNGIAMNIVVVVGKESSMMSIHDPVRISLRGSLFGIALAAICVRASMVSADELDFQFASLIWAIRFISFFGALMAPFQKGKIGMLIGSGVFLCWFALAIYVMGAMR